MLNCRYEPAIVPITAIPENWKKCRIIGFDLNHYDDVKNGISQNFDYCISETKNLLEQINNLIKEE